MGGGLIETRGCYSRPLADEIYNANHSAHIMPSKLDYKT